MQQDYAAYSPADFAVWQLLYERQFPLVQKSAYAGFLEGIDKLRFPESKIPVFTELNRILKRLNGWEIVVVPGLIPARDFFRLLSEKKFCASTWLRKVEQLDYLEEPDMFHDVFGHVPGLTDPAVVFFLERLAKIAMKYTHREDLIELLSRIYWFTIEFGLIREAGSLKIFGAGILSSPGETEYCVSAEATHLPFGAKQILETAFEKDVFQTQYFVLDSTSQLKESLIEIEELMNEISQQIQI